MKQTHRIALSVAFAASAAVALSGCPAQVVKEGAKSIPKASQAQCVNEKDIFEKAVEAYTILKTEPPKNEAALVPDFLRELSPYWDLDAKGNVVPAPGKGC
jgi:glycerol kinase